MFFSPLRILSSVSVAGDTGKWTYKYELMKIIVRAAFYIFYKRVSVSGKYNVPEKGPLIFVSNHQNALMDPLAIIVLTNRQPVFLARSDIFSNPVKAKILNFFKVMPVYRISDGIDTLEGNRQIFASTVKVLLRGGAIGIMPEGTHSGLKRLRPLKKGLFRIGFNAVTETPGGLDVRIVPVGLDFSNHYRFREDIVVNIGEPISLNSYMPLFNEHPQKAINSARKDLAAGLSDLIIDVKNSEFYDSYSLVSDIAVACAAKKKNKNFSARDNFQIKRAVIRAVNQGEKNDKRWIESLRNAAGELKEYLDRYGLNASVFNHSIRTLNIAVRFFLLTVLLPVFVVGFVSHIIPYLLIHLILKRLEDPQFISSWKFVSGFFLIPLNYCLIGALLLSFYPAKVVFPFIGVLFVSGLAACYYKRKLSHFFKSLRLFLLKKRRKEAFSKINFLYGEICSLLKPVLKGVG